MVQRAIAAARVREKASFWELCGSRHFGLANTKGDPRAGSKTSLGTIARNNRAVVCSY